MLLFCPMCGVKHVDAPDERTPDWTNPPHKSHLCHGCGCIWRPADVPTEGVEAIATVGKSDTIDLNAASTLSREPQGDVRDAALVAFQSLDATLKLEAIGRGKSVAAQATRRLAGKLLGLLNPIEAALRSSDSGRG